MFAGNVCLVFLIWCRVSNLSAVVNGETPAADMITLRSGTLLTVPSNESNNRSPGADWGTEINGSSSSGQETASGYQVLQKKLLKELKDYKFVFPQILVGKRKRSITLLPEGSYPDHISISVELEGKEVMLNLSMSRFLLPRGFQVSYYDSNGTLVTEKDTKRYQCSYEGFVRGFPGSQVSASICSGLSALIVFGNRTYVIEHLEGDKHGHHLLYRPEDLPPAPSSCGVKNTSPELNLTRHLQRSQKVKRDVMSEMKYVELVVVADRAMYQNLGNNRDAVIRRVIDVGNAVDLYYRMFNLRVSLIGIEVWTSDQISVSPNVKATLGHFLTWRSEILLPRMHHDNIHLITGIRFDKLLGLGMLNGMCSEQNSGGVNEDSRPTFLAVAATLAHEMGHNLGMTHDTEARGCNCPDVNAGCIMEEALGIALPTTFSSCSRDDLERALLQGVGFCLSNLPDLTKLIGGPKCGNLYTETGEECDCGNPAECSDICCEASTCKLKPGAVCSSTGPCCKECQLLPVGTLCRPVMGDCDLPEFCTGDGSKCPENVFLKDGHSCSSETFYCNNGICQSADKQCEDMWGEGATSAEDVCYEVTNQQGSDFGNCGKDRDHNYVMCNAEDVLCGKIQCKGGNPTPLRGGNLQITITRMVIGGVRYECRGTFSSLADSSSPDLVKQGTKCGDNKACFNHKCLDVSVFGVAECDNTCNNKGVCNNKGNCHCDDGWAPPRCDRLGTGGSIDSRPGNDTATTDRGITTVTQQRTGETPATTDRGITTVTQQRTGETPATTDRGITTVTQQRTGETPATTDRGITTVTQQRTGETPDSVTETEIRTKFQQSTGDTPVTDTGIGTKFQQSTGEIPDSLTTTGIGTKFQQSTGEIPDSVTDTEIRTTFQQSTGETPGVTDDFTYGGKVVVPILAMSFMTFFVTKILMKTGIICRKSPANQLTCRIRSAPNGDLINEKQ
ncbi:disintegrin and metalloproteinase domain-containing protein 12-like [Mustelus asterias]